MVPVGSMKPNDLGLFDMLGNALQWCEDRFAYYSVGEDKEDTKDIIDIDYRMLRGGSFLDQVSLVRSANRARSLPADRNVNVGFRPARTFTP
jgi:formylglycine-generating enzyme required for sulfatase activity